MPIKLSLILFFIAVIIKIFAIFYTNFDLFGDEAQYWIWSQKLDFGYYSKPPLLPWVMGFFTIIFGGNNFEILKSLPLIMYFFTAYVVFLISYELYKNKNLAFLSAISFYLLPSVTVSSFLISTDIILIFFWSLSLLFVIRLRKNAKLLNFSLLGFFLGLSFLAKYAAVYFLLSLIIFIFLDKKLRDVFFKKPLQVVVFLLSAMVVLFPNIIWNIKNNWLTLNHTSDNAALNRVDFNLLQGVEFLLIQGVMVGPLLFWFFIFSVKKIKFSFESIFLLSFSLPVFFIVTVESVLVRANANWAAVGLVSFVILLLNHCYVYGKNIIYINNIINFIFCFCFYFLISTTSTYSVFDRISGVSAFALELKTFFDSQDKIILVVEDRLLYSSLKYEYRDSNILLFAPHDPKSKITSHFHLSSPLPPSFSKNFFYLGDLSQLDYLINKNKKKKIKKRREYRFEKTPINIYEINF